MPVVKLDHIFRQGAGSAIVTNAHRINRGKLPVVGKEITDFFFFEEGEPELAGDLVVDLVARRTPAKFLFWLHGPSQNLVTLSTAHRMGDVAKTSHDRVRDGQIWAISG